jgi:hypothetical protein
MKQNFNLLSLASFIFSLLGLITAFIIPFFLQIIAIVLGHLHLRFQTQSRTFQSGGMYHSMTIISLVVSYIVILINIVALIIMGASVYLFFRDLVGNSSLPI